jgi:mannose-1-phosphate guanylyltransferase/mannose-6-phosphate isomerase
MLTPVILSGGSGTRLWPLSRENQTNPLLALAGQHTMLQETARRLTGFDADATSCTPTIVAYSNEHRSMVAEQFRAEGINGTLIVLEPLNRLLIYSDPSNGGVSWTL